MFITEEELAFSKLESLMKTVRNKWLKFGSTSKLCEIIDILCDVVKERVKRPFENSHFISLPGDACKARKTSEEKEIIFAKVV